MKKLVALCILNILLCISFFIIAEDNSVIEDSITELVYKISDENGDSFYLEPISEGLDDSWSNIVKVDKSLIKGYFEDSDENVLILIKYNDYSIVSYEALN